LGGGAVITFRLTGLQQLRRFAKAPPLAELGRWGYGPDSAAMRYSVMDAGTEGTGFYGS
jgi:hypothetical protein